ncbi:MAG: ABC transporter ATP-binding protein [Bryobacterales bacterium]|nr:ABC transporter ATP-binding protein [Bryobacterales bacterium]
MLLIQKVSKRYSLYNRPADRLWEALPVFGRKRHTDFWALRDITLEVPKGQFLALVGPNGSGKSTLLQIVSGILQPTHGRVVSQGRIAALLELGAGFNPEFSGRENVLLNSEILGVPRNQMIDALPRIEAFAGVGEFIDRPVKEYSSGMYVRLAFATAIHVDPELLIVDEALAVGDAVFAARCVRKFEELKERGVTVLFVSHDLGLVKRLADRAVLMLHGKVEADGRPAEIVNRYVGLVHEWQNREVGTGEKVALGESFRHGDRTSEILQVTLENESREPVRSVESGTDLRVRVRARFSQPSDDPMVGILVRNRLGIDVFGTNTKVEGRKLGSFRAGDELDITFRFPCVLTQQDYTLTVATQHPDGKSQDWRDDVLSFAVTDERATAGLASLPVAVEWEKRPAV